MEDFLKVDSVFGIFNIIIASVIMMLVIGGNTLIIMAIVKTPKLATPSNQFILGLALADLLVGISIPYNTASIYIRIDVSGNYGLFAAKCLLAVVPMLISCYSSFFHIFAISVDRYISLVYPLGHKVHLTKHKMRIIIVLLWLLSIALATVPAYWNRNDLDNNVTTCTIRTLPHLYYKWIMLPIFLLLTLVLIFIYSRIWCIAAQKTSDVKKPLKVIGLVAGCYIVCWTPLIAVLYFRLDPACQLISNPTFTLAYFLVYSSSFANPMIYAWQNKDFRSTFSQFLRCKTNRKNLRGMHVEPVLGETRDLENITESSA